MFKLMFFILGSLCSVCACAGDLTIFRVIPNKIIYAIDETATVAVTVGNKADHSSEATLRLFLCWGFEGRKLLASRDIRLEGSKQAEFVFKWNSGKERYGHEIIAEIIQNKKVVSKRSEFFNVIDEWWRVNMLCGRGESKNSGIKVFDFYHLKYLPYKHSWYSMNMFPKKIGPFLTYANHSMRFSSMPSVYGDLTPDVPEDVTWYSAARYPFKTKLLKEDVAWCKRWGFKNSMFTIISMSGPVGFEIGRRHPEFVARTKSGSFEDGSWSSVPPSPMELAQPITKRMNGWWGLMPDMYNKKTVEFGAEELVDSIKMFGWDGIFFDNCGYIVKPYYSWRGNSQPAPNENQEVVSARNIKLTRDIIRKAFPKTFLWYNGANPSSVGPFLPSGNGGGRKAKIEMMADENSGALFEKQAGQIADPRNAAHAWRSLYEIYLGTRDGIRKKDWGTPTSDILQCGFVGPESFYYSMPKDVFAKTRGQWAWSNYLMSLMAACQMHPAVSGFGFRPIAQLMTRYSQFFWNENLRIMDKSYKKFSIDSLREIWWEEVVYERDTPEYKEIILNLINSPDMEMAVKNIIKDPEAVDDVEVSCLKMKDPKKVKAWAITPYEYNSEVLEPNRVELKGSMVDGELVFEIPPFSYYALVVLRQYK